MTTVLLVDDQRLVRTGFHTILDTEPGLDVVGEAENGEQAVRLAAELTPDVICMDVQMPVMDGIEATRRIVESGSPSAVLILTTFDDDDFLFRTLAAGASGFLLKSAGAEELIAAVQTLGRGDALLAPTVTRRVIQRFAATQQPRERVDDAGTGTIRGGHTPQPAVHLTPREREILGHMASGANNAEIAAELVVGESTIKTHVSNILMKLDARDRIQAVIWAHRHGFG